MDTNKQVGGKTLLGFISDSLSIGTYADTASKYKGFRVKMEDVGQPQR